MKKKTLLIIAATIIALSIGWYFYPSSTSSSAIISKVDSGEFVISVTTTGELDAKNSTEINGPRNLQSVEIWGEIKIDNIVEEGTIVDSGDYIASLDKTVVLNKLKDVDANLDKLNSQITTLKLDSALTLRAARDNMVNMKYATEEAKLEVDNSKFEPPATQRRAEISYEKSLRSLDQAAENYSLKMNKEVTSIQEVMIDYNKDQNRKNSILAILSEFDIKAPQAGMVIYEKTWRGDKIKTGSMISPWRPIVAKLPDLTQMLIKTYVNEIDISKVQVGQEVQIGVDAFPEKSLTGIITQVANIGEEMKNSSAHVFEVIIDVEGQDEDLRPAMTTKNKIITEVLPEAIFIPLECLNTQDSIQFVYTDGRKQQVETAQSNEESIVVTNGLEAGQEVYLYPPEGAEDWKIEALTSKLND
ncbi:MULTISPECIES: efflux RND transporter periplasmic adaptor subunit [unclassified Lentimicrobium]|uniref:efflux RND transporter periplasmic adaptor subunit n=1 Tax=unclassified Lentimicrobium TaxID=2677434 RepID=UPI001555F25A|nr:MULTISPECIES: efflux RND transporter periplasmic adaptor subunit [unclassified Lentimicrobium]NPD47778.1 HlyD family efflux transporter periplasmic adaptor subunit [Lentimicrobium sp. S6]NPD86649.1 HlyD family efflux transporter periplasmic adaptor subunit [Lentimicrobium sp. L6]